VVGPAGSDLQVAGAVGGEQQRQQPAQREQHEDRLLSDPGARTRISATATTSSSTSPHRERDLIRKLEHLTGKTVTLQPDPHPQPAA
jgi:hypothetical protein